MKNARGSFENETYSPTSTTEAGALENRFLEWLENSFAYFLTYNPGHNNLFWKFTF